MSSYTLKYINGSIYDSYWNVVFLYQYRIEEWLKLHDLEPNDLDVITPNALNVELLQIVYKSDEVSITVEIKSSDIDQTIDIQVQSNIKDDIMLDNFQTKMAAAKQKVVLEHEEREHELEYERHELCAIEYAMDNM